MRYKTIRMGMHGNACQRKDFNSTEPRGELEDLDRDTGTGRFAALS